jgi:HlyD family secretion protein
VRKVFLWGLGALVLLAVAAYGVWWWKFRDTLHYVTARVSRGDIRRSINMTGALNPVVTAQVGSFVSGNIKSWSCDYNTQVKVGQQCALIDPLPFQVVVDETDADLRTSRAQLVKDKAAAANARVVYERDKKLRDQGIVSQETLDADKSTLDQDVATIDLDVATIASKQAALHAAQVNLGYTNIVSPVNGTVITRYIDVGYTVVSNLQSSTLFLIGKDMTSMQVDTNVSEADVGEVHDGQKANFTVQAYPNRTFEATVRQVRKGPITVQNVVTYDVVLDVPNKDLALLPGMTSDTHIITAERKNVLRVPLPAIRFVPEGMGRAGRGGVGGGAGRAEEGAGGRTGGGAGGGTGGVEVAQGGSGAPGGAGPGGTDDGLVGAGGAKSSGASGAGTNGQGDNSQQRHHRWNRDQGPPGANGRVPGAQPDTAATAGPASGVTAGAASAQGGGGAGPGGENGAAGARRVEAADAAGGAGARGPGAAGAGGAGAARRGRGPRAMARVWVLRSGVLTPVVVRTGLDDGTLVEIYSEDLKEGDEVVVNAVRPNAPRPAAGERPAAGGQGAPNGGRGGGAGGGFRL